MARHERLVIENDPLARYSTHILVNMTKPEHSPILQAPLAKAAGGWGRCGNVFESKDDPDYRRMLQTLEESKTASDRIPRYSTPAWKPNRQYVREMKRFGIVDESFDMAQGLLDPFKTDQLYWESFWWKGK